MKLNLSDCTLDDKGKEEFLANIDNFMMYLVLEMDRPHAHFIEVQLK